MEYTTEDGFTIRVFSSMYIDWGLEITKDGQSLYNCPSALSRESYGFKPAPQYADWEEAEEAAFEGDVNAFVEWEESDWTESLAEEADTLIEAYVREIHTVGFTSVSIPTTGE